jgi:hypothetical protein
MAHSAFIMAKSAFFTAATLLAVFITMPLPHGIVVPSTSTPAPGRYL